MRKLRTYDGPGIRVTYDLRRCIHAAECVRGLPTAFDPARRPWIDLQGTDPSAVAAVVVRCPTGALGFQRLDGGPAEAPPPRNTATVERDGPLLVAGQIRIERPNGDPLTQDTRVALCRCGASGNKPFCDGSHVATGFSDD